MQTEVSLMKKQMQHPSTKIPLFGTHGDQFHKSIILNLFYFAAKRYEYRQSIDCTYVQAYTLSDGALICLFYGKTAGIQEKKRKKDR